LVPRRAFLVVVGALCSLAVCAPAAAAKPRHYAFVVTTASMSEVMSFQGDGGPDCARSGVCGFSGTIDYSFGGADGVAVFETSGRRASGTGDFFFNGLTSATVQGPDGGPPCTEKAIRTADGFEVSGTPGRMRMVFHSPFDVPNSLDSYCTGPSDLDMWHAHALPTLTLSARSLRAKSLRLQTSSTRQFHAGPFVGALTFRVDMRLRQSRQLSGIFQFLVGGLRRLNELG
jgi:hypothetical protein